MKNLFPIATVHLITAHRAGRALALAGALLAPAGAARAQTPATFAAVSTYPIGASTRPTSVAVADVNGDGRPDIVTANFTDNTAGVLLGQAGGSFAAVITYSTGAGSQPFDVAVADMNGDGRLDIVTANFASDNAGVLLGQAGGGFAAVSTYPTGPFSRPSGVALADVNSDGRLDIVTANYNTDDIGVLLGQAGGGFAAVSTYPAGSSSAPYSVAVADVNGDGRPDIATANGGSSTAGVLLGQAGGGFAAVSTYPVGAGSRPTSVALADVSGDGRLDIVTANYTSDNIGVLHGQAGGGFAAVSTYSTGASTLPTDVAVADVNSDGRLDIVTANYYPSTYNGGGSTVGVLLGQSGGGFATVSTYPTGAGTEPYGVAVADLNGDGKPDIVTANYVSDDVGVLLNTTAAAAAPTLTSVNPASGPVGTSVTLTGTNLTGPVGVSFNGTAATTFAGVNSTTVTATVPTGTTTGLVTVTTPSGTSNGVTFTLTSPPPTDLVVSTGTLASPTPIPAGTYNTITVTGTGVGQLVGATTLNTALVVQSGGALLTNCQPLTGAGTFTLAAGATLAICDPDGIAASGATGAVQTTGARSFSTDAGYLYNGTAAQITGSGLPAQVRNLGTTNANSVTLSAPTSVAQVLTVGGAGNLVLNGQALVLLSSAAGTGLAVNSGTGVVSGTATVQRYIDPSLNAGPGYRHYSSPVANTTVGDLATAGFTPTLTTSYNASATPGTTTPFPTVFGYDQARVPLANAYAPFDRGYVVPAALASPLAVGQGYAVNIAGNQLVDFVGTLTNGDQAPLALARVAGNPDAGWQLLGNPYPAPLDYALVAPADRPNLDAAIYVYSSSGPYVGQYRSYLPPVGGNPGIGNGVLPVAQGFFARVSAGQTSGALTFRNSQRLTAPNATPFQRPNADPRPLVQLDLRGATGPADALYAYAQTGATPAFDSQFDAEKISNSTGLNLSSTATSGQRLAIDGRPVFDAATVLALNIGVPAAGTYTLSAASLNNLPTGLDAYLRDAQTGQTVNLRTQPTYIFAVTAAQATALLVGRFTLQFSATALATAPALTATQVELYPNPAHARFSVQLPGVLGAATVQAELLNALGQVVRRQSAVLPASGTTLAVETDGLAAGVYTLHLQAGNASLAKRVVLQ
ncbi:hypothetical protein GCM10022409_25800 [Hymenobacter glaciei]|uniref:Secretion system C-terminal sorting domain-containing protein n=1 Tax=Hymenobacter glaciei TaxID=877209 RepID=A0ABP7UAH6_9BACT